MQLLTTLALVAFVLAAAGIYAVLTFSIARRTREIGVRMPVGADARHIVRMVVSEGMRVVAVGAVIGVVAAVTASRLLQAALFEISPTIRSRCCSR